MLTVLFATYNGATTLARSLENFCLLNQPEGGYKLVVVDNASTDETPEILKAYESRLPLTSVRIEEQGKNKALNKGLKFIEGDLVVLTDDDTIGRKDWLVKLRGMADTQPEVALWGGAIEPIWPTEPPSWILEQVPLGAVYALTDPDQNTGHIPPDMVWGPNMAVRSEVFAAGHRFNENIGPAAGQYTMGSEVEFTCRMAEEGYSCWFVREAVVGHIIRPNQMLRSWVIKRAYRFGKLKYVQKQQESRRKKDLVYGVPRWRYRLVVTSFLKSWSYQLTRNESARFKSDWDFQYHLGYIAAAWSYLRKWN